MTSVLKFPPWMGKNRMKRVKESSIALKFTLFVERMEESSIANVVKFFGKNRGGGGKSIVNELKFFLRGKNNEFSSSLEMYN